ncbi:hypothetical protein M947_06145 [Sulfurimonas hongkongensis]|uniref:Uncharacterized protein n=1 Tax=Sulfurimonas hongkongensis TaxID=1172190 RepID=T0JEX6_9BACT|nr:hypothetical protein M947_06145 [Sulfurimonas hongkongensis]
MGLSFLVWCDVYIYAFPRWSVGTRKKELSDEGVT